MRQQTKLRNSAIGIVRISSRRQEENTSQETQAAEIKAYCIRENLDLIKTEIIVESAKNSEDRKKYHLLINGVINSGIGNIVFHRLDRESRNLTDNEQNERLVRSGKLRLHYVQERRVFDQNTSPSDFMSRDINAAVNKGYCRELSLKVNRAMNAKAEMGWYPGNRVPLGYRTRRALDQDGREASKGLATIIADPDPKRRLQVQREFALRAEGLSYEEIRRTIVQEGLVPSDKLRSYRKGTIQYRLTDPFYWGDFRWKGQIYKGLHPLIIPEGILCAVSARNELRGHNKRARGAFDGGWLRCASCGCSVIYDPKSKTIKGTGEVRSYKYYHCSNGRGLHSSMAGMSVTEDDLWKQFRELIKTFSIAPGLASEIAGALNETKGRAKAAIQKQMQSFRESLKQTERTEDELYKDFKRGLIGSESSYKRQLEEVRSERHRLAEELERAELQVSDASVETAQSILELCTNAELLWMLKSAEERVYDLKIMVSNPTLDGQILQYEKRKPFSVLSKMVTSDEWWAHLDEFRTACLGYAA